MMMRVAGKAEFLKEKALEERLYRDRPWVKDLPARAPHGGEVAIFRLAHGKHISGPWQITCGKASRVKF